jgi:hypothetical protein
MGGTSERAPGTDDPEGLTGEPAAGVSVGDGTLGGLAIGGSVTGPDAGVVRDPVGAELTAPITTTPDDPEQPGEVSDDLGNDAERPSGT